MQWSLPKLVLVFFLPLPRYEVGEGSCGFVELLVYINTRNLDVEESEKQREREMRGNSLPFNGPV